MKKILAGLKLPKLGAIYGIALLVLTFSITAPNFISISNFSNIIVQSPVTCIITICCFLAILTHQIDLSVGAIAGLAGVVTASILGSGANLLVACLTGLVVGTAVGVCNGILIAHTKVDPFIITLGTMGIIESVAMVIAQGNTLRISSNAFTVLGEGYLWIFPLSTIMTLAIGFFFNFLLTKVPYGVHLYAIGGKEDAASASGINVKKLKVSVFAINGLLAGIAGLILASRLGSANPSQGIGLELDGITATVLGGASILGGTGNIWGVLLGAMAINILRNGLNMLGYSAALQLMIVGIIMIMIIVFDNIRSRRDEN